jgi:hypothetical protein
VPKYIAPRHSALTSTPVFPNGMVRIIPSS